MKITIIGSGYVGLVSGACFADLGNEVRCIDIDKNKIEKIKCFDLPFYEPSLSEVINKNVNENRLFFESDYKNISDSDILFLCIDTPKDKQGKPNLTNLDKAVSLIADNLKTSILIVTKSTVPIGTNKKILMKLQNKFNDDSSISIDVCSNPEFLKEGSAVNDFFRPERIIVGASCNKVFSTMRRLYKPLNRKANHIIEMSIESAEITKYAANAFLATKISFINQIARVAEFSGANIHEIRHGIGSDSRIGKDFLYAGLGYGGSCFPKDIQALIEIEKSLQIDSSLLESVVKINSNQLDFFINKIKKTFDQDLHSKSLLVWGMSFKPNTDDIRESVGIKFLEKISDQVEKVYVYDPVVKALPEHLNNVKIISLSNQYDCIENCHALVICTEWKQFWDPDIDSLALLQDKIIFDGRNILDVEILEKNEFKYFGIGINQSGD